MRLEDRGKNLWATFTADMVRYSGTDVNPWSLRFMRCLAAASYEHPGLLAVVVYRYGQFVFFRCRIPLVRQLLNLHYYCCFNWVRTRLQIELPRTSCIDAGLRIDHYGGILVNCQIIAGKNLTLNQGVLLGQTDTGVPVLGDGVTMGAGARIIGGVTIGNEVIVGAGALVTHSFPDRAVVAGVPARLLRIQPPTTLDTRSAAML